MISKESLKQYLLSFDGFIDNQALDEYLELTLTHLVSNASRAGYSEKHHIIPVACYKTKYDCDSRVNALKYADRDSMNLTVSLLYKDHCKAHYLLYFCTTGWLKHANAETVNYMFSVYPALTRPQGSQKFFKYVDEDFDILQKYMDDIREDSASRYWKQFELEFLKKNYADHGVQYCADRLDRSYPTVKSKARDLGLKVNVFRYSEETKRFLREHYPTKGTRYCATALGMDLNKVKDLAAYLGLKMEKWWSEDELKYLAENFATLGYKKCATQLNRTECSVRAKASDLGLTKDQLYTDTEKQFIIEHYPKEGLAFCAEHLNRQPDAIKRYASQTLKVLRPPQGDPLYCPELDQYFDSIKDASIKLNLSDGNICSVLKGRLKNTKGYTFVKVSKEDYYNEKRKNQN